MDNVRLEYYTAQWCGPCRSVRPILDELKAEGWNIEKIDVDQNKAQAQANQIMAVPTFIVYRDGVAVRRFSGARNKAGILGELNLAAQ
jgi:thioredoxin 1